MGDKHTKLGEAGKKVEKIENIGKIGDKGGKNLGTWRRVESLTDKLISSNHHHKSHRTTHLAYFFCSIPLQKVRNFSHYRCDVSYEILKAWESERQLQVHIHHPPANQK